MEEKDLAITAMKEFPDRLEDPHQVVLQKLLDLKREVDQ